MLITSILYQKMAYKQLSMVLHYIKVADLVLGINMRLDYYD